MLGDYLCDDGLVRCWDTATGKESASFHVPGWVLQFALSPDGKTLAVDATQQLHAVLFVSVPDGKEIRRIEATSTSPGANLYFNRLDFSPDGKTLAAVGNNSVCRLFEVGTGKTILHLTGEVKTSGRFPTAFSPDGKRIALIGQENTLRVVEIATEKEVFKRQVKQDDEYRLLNMSFSPDGKKLAWVGEDEKTFALWDIATGESGLQFRSPEKVESVHFSPDGKRIAAVYSDSKEPAGPRRFARRVDPPLGRGDGQGIAEDRRTQRHHRNDRLLAGRQAAGRRRRPGRRRPPVGRGDG